MTDGETNTHGDGTNLEWFIHCCCCWFWWTTGIQSDLLSQHIPHLHRWYSEIRHCNSELCTVKGALLKLLYNMQPVSLQIGLWSCEGGKPSDRLTSSCANTDAAKPSCAVYDLSQSGRPACLFSVNAVSGSKNPSHAHTHHNCCNKTYTGEAKVVDMWELSFRENNRASGRRGNSVRGGLETRGTCTKVTMALLKLKGGWDRPHTHTHTHTHTARMRWVWDTTHLQFCASVHHSMSNETPTWCNTVQVLFLQGHSTCFGRKRPSSVFKTSTAATGTCVIVAGKSSHLLIRAERP